METNSMKAALLVGVAFWLASGVLLGVPHTYSEGRMALETLLATFGGVLIGSSGMMLLLQAWDSRHP
jgi:hypothetical protein